MGHVRGLSVDDVLQAAGLVAAIVGLFLVFPVGIALVLTGVLLIVVGEVVGALRKGRP